MKRTCVQGLSLALLLLSWLCLWGCGESRLPYVGTYRSDEAVGNKGHIEIILRDNGEADWNWVDENRSVKLKWRVQDGRVWLYFKEGIILIATPFADHKKLAVDISGEWNPGCPVDKCINFTRQK
jgi:hypothetical protein